VLRLFDISSRRYRIVDIQNEAKQYLPGCDFIFGLEDDTIPPPHALRQLQRDYAVYPYAGLMVALAVLGLVVILAFPPLRDVASPSFIASLASRATASRAIPPGLSGATIKPNGELASVREWARGQGYSVSDRGRISANVMAAYETAH
jgi:Lsr2 protein